MTLLRLLILLPLFATACAKEVEPDATAEAVMSEEDAAQVEADAKAAMEAAVAAALEQATAEAEAPEAVEEAAPEVDPDAPVVSADGFTRTSAPAPPNGLSPGKRLLIANAGCTRKACPAGECCNTCSSRGWHVDGGGAATQQDDLPVCDVDGCGKCDFALEARGYQSDPNTYVVLEWKKVDPPEMGTGGKK